MTTALMTEGTSPPRPRLVTVSALDLAARLWFAAAVVGQAMFLAYIVILYFPTTLTGDFQAWNLNKSLINGYVAGDVAGNLAFAAHVLMAGVITFGGTLQLVPQIRARAPAIHRWIGRAFLSTALIASLAGLYMTWGRDSGPLVGRIAISLDGALIIGFAFLAWRDARARQFASHRRWAMRTFMVANAVWFLRLGFAPYGLLMKALGGKPSMEDPFFVFWSFGCFLVPLAVLELYFLARDRGGPGGRAAMAGGLLAATALMAVGIAGSWLFIFAPTLARLGG